MLHLETRKLNLIQLLLQHSVTSPNKTLDQPITYDCNSLSRRYIKQQPLPNLLL